MFSGRPTLGTEEFTHNVGPEAEALPLMITDGDVEGKTVPGIAYNTHPLKAACQEKKLPRTPNRLRFFLQVFFGLTPHGRLGSDSSFTDGAEKAIRTAHPYVLITTNCTGYPLLPSVGLKNFIDITVFIYLD